MLEAYSGDDFCMKIKRFVGDSFLKPYDKPRADGNDAVILYSRKYKEGGCLGCLAAKFEITVLWTKITVMVQSI